MGNLFKKQSKIEKRYCFECKIENFNPFYDFCCHPCQSAYLIRTDPNYLRKQREESEYYKLWTLTDNLPVPPSI